MNTLENKLNCAIEEKGFRISNRASLEDRLVRYMELSSYESGADWNVDDARAAAALMILKHSNVDGRTEASSRTEAPETNVWSGRTEAPETNVWSGRTRSSSRNASTTWSSDTTEAPETNVWSGRTEASGTTVWSGRTRSSSRNASTTRTTEASGTNVWDGRTRSRARLNRPDFVEPNASSPQRTVATNASGSMRVSFTNGNHSMVRRSQVHSSSR
jgi:hypothetical protein